MGFIRSFRRQMSRQMKQREIAAEKRRRKVRFEPLEPRILLSDTFSYTAAAAMDMTLQVTGDNIELIDNSDGSLLQRQLLVDTSAVVITGSEEDDSLQVDFDFDALDDPIPVSFDGDEGDDTLVGLDADSTWHIFGNDSGSVAGVDFSSVEALEGSNNGQDTFSVENEARWSGTIDGGNGSGVIDVLNLAPVSEDLLFTIQDDEVDDGFVSVNTAEFGAGMPTN